VLNLRRDETAVLCLLMLRGPQTPGELRSRADRLYTFDDISAVQSTLDRLASRPPAEEDPSNPNATGPLTTILPRQPGSRESRHAHLLGSQPEPSAAQHRPTSSSTDDPTALERIARMEAKIAFLSTTLQALEARVGQLESAPVSDKVQ